MGFPSTKSCSRQKISCRSNLGKMAAYDTEKPSSTRAKKLHREYTIVLSILSVVLFIVLLFLFTTLTAVYSRCADGATVAELRAEIEILRSRVSRLENSQTKSPTDDEDEVPELWRLLGDEMSSASQENEHDRMSYDVLPNAPSRPDGDPPAENELTSRTTKRDPQYDVLESKDIYHRGGDEVASPHDSVGYDSTLITSQEADFANVKGGRPERQLWRERRQTGNSESRGRVGDRGNGGRGHGDRGGRGSRRESRGERSPRCRRVQDCIAVPAFAHFEGDIRSATEIHPQRIHPLAWKMLNVSDTWIQFWRIASWTPLSQRSKFSLHFNGTVSVHEGGFYYVYSQVQYYDQHRYMGHAIVINGQVRFRCAASPVNETRKINTCHIGGLTHLSPGSLIGIRLASSNRVINMHHDSSFFGLYRVAE